MEGIFFHRLVLSTSTSNNQRLRSAGDNDRRSKGALVVLCVCFKWQTVKYTRDQITSNRRSKHAWSNYVICIPFILSGSPNERWLHKCNACVITPWRLGLRAPLVNKIYNSWWRDDLVTRWPDTQWRPSCRHELNIPVLSLYCSACPLTCQLAEVLLLARLNFSQVYREVCNLWMALALARTREKKNLNKNFNTQVPIERCYQISPNNSWFNLRYLHRQILHIFASFLVVVLWIISICHYIDSIPQFCYHNPGHNPPPPRFTTGFLLGGLSPPLLTEHRDNSPPPTDSTSSRQISYLVEMYRYHVFFNLPKPQFFQPLFACFERVCFSKQSVKTFPSE